MLVVDDDAHVREARQHVGERRLRTDPVELQVEPVAVRDDADRERVVVGQPLELGEVGDGSRPR